MLADSALFRSSQIDSQLNVVAAKRQAKK
jgi:hypothetical protein